MVAVCPIAAESQNQWPQIPVRRDIPATTRGVSEEKVVATMEVPAMNQDRLRPATKKSAVLRPALLVKQTPTPTAATMYKPMIVQSSQLTAHRVTLVTISY